ncbi:methyltransferase [Holotrichia oblita]|uniref:Methyltransferase n=1 Tax=Holotrichia oblita TaxID=644536 RepID=A0ACB9SNQ4_HOLOL|nr:methyltransferase [Holotrichia oblita]
MDKKEVEKFQSMTDMWWNLNGPAKGLHTMNKLRVPFVINSLKSIGFLKTDENSDKPLQDVSILDVGCGCGIMTEPLSRLGADVTGVDGVPEMIKCAEDHAALDKDLKEIKYFAEPIQTFSERNKEKFDVVVASELLEHVTDKAGVVKSSVECLKPGGSIFITTESKTLLSKWITIYWIENIVKAVPKGAHEIDMYITPEDTQKLLEQSKNKN